jgi:heme exporter protein A
VGAGAPATDPAAVELAGLSRRRGERLALRDVTATVPAGAELAVLGPNGAGKSTLLRVLAALLRPHAGTVRVLGEDLPRRAWAVRASIGLAAHDPMLYRDLSPRENLEYHAQLFGVARERIGTLLEQAGLAGRADDPVRSLSQGMVQRAAMCRALLHEPELILLDEPRANLDPAGAAALQPLLAGRTRIVTSHDPPQALAEADLALGLKAGRVAFFAPSAEVAEADVKALYA